MGGPGYFYKGLHSSPRSPQPVSVAETIFGMPLPEPELLVSTTFPIGRLPARFPLPCTVLRKQQRQHLWGERPGQQDPIAHPPSQHSSQMGVSEDRPRCQQREKGELSACAQPTAHDFPAHLCLPHHNFPFFLLALCNFGRV